MKILFITYSLEHGGAERVCSTLTRFLAEQGHQVRIRLFYRKIFFKTDPNVEISVNRFLSYSRPAAFLTALYWFLFPNRKPDVIVSFLWMPNLFASILGKLTGIPVILSERGNPEKSHNIPAVEQQCRTYFRYASRMVVLSEGAAQFMRGKFFLKEQQVCVIHNPLQIMDTRKADKSPFPYSFLLAVGRLHPVKGYDRMLRVFAKIHQKFSEKKLVFCGEGPQRDEILKWSSEAGLKDSVILAGTCSDVALYYQHADALLFTSYHEGQPNVILEAQSCGCPVIAFDCDYGPSYLIQNGKTGLVIPDGDEAAMAEAVINYLKHPEMKDMFRENMPEHLKQFAPEKIYQQWIDLIQEVSEK